jgi:hypothetical protein
MNGFRETLPKNRLFARNARVPIGTDEDFKGKIRDALARGPLTWTEIRTVAKLPQKFPNNKWVRQLEQDISLKRNKDANGILKWKL